MRDNTMRDCFQDDTEMNNTKSMINKKERSLIVNSKFILFIIDFYLTYS